MKYAAVIVLTTVLFLGVHGDVAAQGSDGQTIQDGSRNIELNPNSAEAWWMRGNAYWDGGDLDRALADYNQALALDPDYAMAYLGRGNVYLRKGDPDAALEEYNQVVEILPEFIGTYNNMGVAYREKGQRDLAIQSFDLAIGWKPDFAEALYNRGLTYRDMGEQELADQDFKRAVDLNPNLAQAADNRNAASSDDRRGRAPALENPKSVAQMKAQLRKGASSRVALNRKKSDTRRLAQTNEQVSEPGAKQTAAQAGDLAGLSLLLCGLPVAAGIIIGLVLLWRRTRP